MPRPITTYYKLPCIVSLLTSFFPPTSCRYCAMSPTEQALAQLCFVRPLATLFSAFSQVRHGVTVPTTTSRIFDGFFSEPYASLVLTTVIRALSSRMDVIGLWTGVMCILCAPRLPMDFSVRGIIVKTGWLPSDIHLWYRRSASNLHRRHEWC